MPQIDPSLIAARLRGLFAWPDAKRLTTLASELQVSERALAAAIDQRAPQQSVTVLVAVAQPYAIDPTWLMTGKYDVQRHRAAHGSTRRPPEEVIAELMAEAQRTERLEP